MTAMISHADLIDVPERRAVAQAFEVRSAGHNIARITGYASVFNRGYEVHGGPDAGGWTEVVTPAAFKRTLSQDPHVHFLVNHEGLPLASTKSKTLKLSTDSTGLITEAEVDRRNSRANDMVLTLERGDADEMSFAFRVKAQTWGDNDIRSLDEVSLHKGDVSVVSFGANPFTSVGVRNAVKMLAREDLQPEQLAELRAMSEQVDRAMRALTAVRSDASEPYGPGDYADPGYLDGDGNQASKSGKKPQKRFPLFPKDRIRNALSRIEDQKVKDEYTPEQYAHVKAAIVAAAKKAGIGVESNSLRSNPQSLIAGLDAVLDEALDLTGDVDREGLPEPVGQALDLLVAAQGVVGKLMSVLGIFDPDNPGREGNALRAVAPNIFVGNPAAFAKQVHDLALTGGADCDLDTLDLLPAHARSVRALSPMLDDDAGLQDEYSDKDGSVGSLAQAVHDLVADQVHDNDLANSAGTVNPDDDAPYNGRNLTVAGAQRAAASPGNLTLAQAVQLCRPEDSPNPLTLDEAMNLAS